MGLIPNKPPNNSHLSKATIPQTGLIQVRFIPTWYGKEKGVTTQQMSKSASFQTFFAFLEKNIRCILFFVAQPHHGHSKILRVFDDVMPEKTILCVCGECTFYPFPKSHPDTQKVGKLHNNFHILPPAMRDREEVQFSQLKIYSPYPADRLRRW